MPSEVYVLKSAEGKPIAQFFDMTAALIFMRAYFENYYNEKNLKVSIERVNDGE